MSTFELYNGDCLEVMKDISSNSIDLILCDLPYGCLTGGGTLSNTRGSSYGQNSCSWDIKINLEDFWTEVKRIRKNEHAPTLHFCTTKFGIDLINSNPKEFRYDLVWDKGRGVSFLSANKMPMRSHEMCYVFSKEGAYYKRVDISGNFKGWSAKVYKDKKSLVYSSGMPNGYKTTGNDGTKRSVLSVIHNPSYPKGGHPTEKPLELYKFLIERYCPLGGTVLDPTFGSCNSGRAAEALGRNYIGIEKDKGFYDKAAKSLGCE